MGLLLVKTFALLALIGVANSAIGDVCTTAKGTSGSCVLLYDCQVLYSAFERRNLTPQVISFLRRSQCGFQGSTPLLCCSADITNSDLEGTSNTRPTQRPQITSPRPRPTQAPSSSGSAGLLPKRGECGQESSLLPDRIYNGQITDLDEFPWMALLVYSSSKGGGEVLECGGVLINQRYVLTAAHCVVGEVNQKVGRLIKIRLGEYNTQTERDCIEDYCAEPHQDIPVEEVIAHEGFSDKNIDRRNDIALVRLSRNAVYSEFVSPICLPQSPVRLNVGDEVFIAGWGRTLEARHSQVKLKLQIPIFNKEQCKRLYARGNANISDRQLCAGGEFKKDSCYGDSGGPLMKSDLNSVWTSVGIVSFGNGCGQDGWPGIYTNVEPYMDWIRQNIRA